MEVRWLFCAFFTGFLGVEGFFWGSAMDAVKNGLREIRSFRLIYPGTKWCGSGTKAKDENDLGRHAETDSCCRAHDLCPEKIKAGQSKNGLTNPGLFSRLSCDCDEAFLKCLRNKKKKAADMKTSKAILKIYFDLSKKKCYKLEHRITGCKKYNWLALRCDKYSVDPDSPKTWQWFDVPGSKSNADSWKAEKR